MITLVYSKRVSVHNLKLHDQIDITHHQSIAAGKKQQLFGRPSSKKKGPVFVINIFSRSHKLTSHVRNWDKKSRAILQNFDSWIIVIQKRPFGTWQFGKIGVLFNFINQELNFWKIAQFFFVLVPLVREKFERSKENIKHKKSGPREKLPWFSFKKAM